MKFSPSEDSTKIPVPFYSTELRAAEGWMGHTVGKSLGTLKAELSAALGRLGAAVTGFQRGIFTDEDTGLKREGIVITYSVPTASGKLWPGQISIASLPVDRESCQNDNSYETKKDKSLCMALFMTITYIRGAWNMQVLSPGLSPLLPWMIASDAGETFSELFSLKIEEESNVPRLPAQSSAPDIITVDFTETEDKE